MEKRRLDDISESTEGFYVLVQSVQENTTEQRNNITHTSSFTQDGVELAIKDVWFRKDTNESMRMVA